MILMCYLPSKTIQFFAIQGKVRIVISSWKGHCFDGPRSRKVPTDLDITLKKVVLMVLGTFLQHCQCHPECILLLSGGCDCAATASHMHENNRKFPFWLQKWHEAASAKYRTDGKRYFVPSITWMHWPFGQFGKTHNSCTGHQHHVVLHRRDLHQIASFGHFLQHRSHRSGTTLPLWGSRTLRSHVRKVKTNDFFSEIDPTL